MRSRSSVTLISRPDGLETMSRGRQVPARARPGLEESADGIRRRIVGRAR